MSIPQSQSAMPDTQYGIGAMTKSLLSVIRYSLRVYYRYPANILMTIAIPLVFVIVGSVFSKLTSEEQFAEFAGGGTSLLVYLLVGLAVWLLSNASNGVAGAVETEISWGTLSARLRTPTPAIVVISGMALASILHGLVISVVVVTLLFLVTRLTFSFQAVICVCLGLAAFYGVGLILASLALRFRRIGGLITSLGFVEQFFCGAFIPVRALPIFIRPFSYILPSTWVLDSVRATLLGLDTILDPRVEMYLIVAMAAAANITGFLLLRATERKISILGLSEDY